MKKLLSVVICLVLAAVSTFAFSACSREKVVDDAPTQPDIVGGWQASESAEITKELRTVFEKAAVEYTGVDFVPVAFLSSQVVAGINYCFLCEATPVVPGSKTNYALVYIYENLEGNAEITDVKNCDFELSEPGLDGGWAKRESLELNDEAKKALENASQTLTGAQFEPFVLLSTQAAATMNYCLLCKETATVPNAQSEWTIVTVAAMDEASAEIMNIYEFENDGE